MDNDVLYDKKWIKFRKKARLFKYIPFIDFAVAAGSMALGNVHEKSDFDVIIGARSGRIFTSRFFAVLAFGLFGWRRTKISHNEAAKDKICLNHFVTPSSFCLSPPHGKYWKALYKSLVPLYGSTEMVQKFFDANSEWIEEPVFVREDLRYAYKKASLFKTAAEKLLGGMLGDVIEGLLKTIQIERIKKSLRADQIGYKPRIVYSDKELEFHPDTSRIEQLEKTM